MNNWRLLLLAVVAALQPIGSYTENFIDGSQECCDHRSHSKNQDTRLYGSFRKITPEERRLSFRDDIREERRYEARNDPITSSRERRIQERTERRISPAFTVRPSTETRFTKDSERRQLEARQREEQTRRNRKSIYSGNSLNQYERDTFESRRVKMIRNDPRTGSERLQRKSVDFRHADRVRDSEDIRRVSVLPKTIAELEREPDAARSGVYRDSRIIREHRLSDRGTRESADGNRRSRSLESRVDVLRRIDLRENRRSNFRVVDERIDERRQDQNRVSRDRAGPVLRDNNRVSEDRSIESREHRINRFKNNNNERVGERHEQRDVSRISQQRSSKTTAERRQLQTRIIDANVRSDERKLAVRDAVLRRSRDNRMERSQNAGVSQIVEASTRDERLVRSDEKQAERRQTNSRSLDRVFIREASRELNELNFNSQNAARFAERNVRNDRTARYRRDLNSAETLTENREHRELRESQDSVEKRQETRRNINLRRFEAVSRSEREFRIHGNLRHNTRFDANSREYREIRAFRSQDLARLIRNTGRINDDLTRISRFSVRTDERISRTPDVQKVRSDLHRDIRGVDQDSRAEIVTQQLTRDASAPQERFEFRRITRNTDKDARIQRTRSLEYSRKETSEMRENRATRSGIFTTRVFTERAEDRQRKSRVIRDSNVNNREEIIRNHRDVRMVHRQQDKSRLLDGSFQRQSRDIHARSAERRSQNTASRDGEIRFERLSRIRSEKKFNERDVRNDIRVFRAVESRRESRATEKENQPDLNIERRTNEHVRIEAKLRSSNKVLTKEVPANTRYDHDAIDTRFRSFEATIREIPVDDQSATTWQMVFYALQGAYLCALLIQVLSEKSYKGKSRSFSWWGVSKDLVKVD